MSKTKNADYFPHPSSFRNDRRVRRAMKDLPGGVGYGAIVILMERLRCESDYSYPFSDLDLLADEFDISLPILETVIKSYGLFEFKESENNKWLISPVLNSLMAPYQEKVEQNRIAGHISAKKRKMKMQKQLDELSQQHSSQQLLSFCSTEENRIEEKRKNNKRGEKVAPENSSSISLLFFSEHEINNFMDLRQFLSINNRSVDGAQIKFKYGDQIISISDIGAPYINDGRAKGNLSFSEGDQFFKYLFQNPDLVIEAFENTATIQTQKVSDYA